MNSRVKIHYILPKSCVDNLQYPELTMTDHVEIAIYAEHTASAGRMVPDPNSANPDDMQIFAGTHVELAELAREYCQLVGAQFTYFRKCGRVILDELYSTGAIEAPIWDECESAEQWCDIANDVLADCGIGVHSDDAPQIWYECRSIVNSLSSYDMVSLHEPDVAIDIADWQDLNRQDIRVVAHRYLQSID